MAARCPVALLFLLIGCTAPVAADDGPPPPGLAGAGEVADLAAVPDGSPAPDLGDVPLFDLPLIRDQASAKCAFSNQRMMVRDGVPLTVWDVSYSSFESRGGRLQPILIRGF